MTNDISPQTLDWGRLGRRLVRARGTRTRKEISAATGVSETTIKDLEVASRPRRKVTGHLTALADYYEWSPDSIERVLAGGEPELVPSLPRVRLELASEDAETVARAIANSRGLPPNERIRLVREILGHPANQM